MNELPLKKKEIKATDLVVRIENDFLFNAFFHLTGNDYDAITFCIGLLEPNSQDNFHKISIPAKELFNALGIDYLKNRGSYDQLRTMAERMATHIIKFPKGFKMTDKQSGKQYEVGGAISWFQYFLITKDENGEVRVNFCFSEILKYSLLHLQEYASLGYKESKNLKGGSAKHQYILLRAYRRKMKKHTPHVTRYRVALEKWKKLLGLDGQYERYKDFNYYILKPALKEINKSKWSKISYSYKSIREGRKTKYIEFSIWDTVVDTSKKEDFVPTEEDIGNLTYAKKLAYEELVGFGVIGGIAYRQLIPSIKGLLFEGFEDYFVKGAIAHFKKTATIKTVAVFVDWWHKHKAFDIEGGVWGAIAESVSASKTKLERDKKDIFDNRDVAKGMPYTEFVKWYKDNRTTKKKDF